MFDLSKASRIQSRLEHKIRLEWTPRPLRMVGGIDCSYHKQSGRVGAVAVVQTLPGFEVIATAESICPIPLPYIPGFLNYREGPAVIAALRKLTVAPDVTLIDGNGTAHPRRMGLAAYVGVILDICTIGCAKSPFFSCREPAAHRGSATSMRNRRQEKVGLCLRTRTGVKPVYVSPGNHIDFAAARRIVLTCARFRIPEPLREAHRRAALLFD